MRSLALPLLVVFAQAACGANEIGCGDTECGGALGDDDHDGDSDHQSDTDQPSDAESPDLRLFGPIDVGPDGVDLAFTVPAGLVSWTLTVSSPTPADAELVVASLRAPDGTVLFDATAEVSINPAFGPYPGAVSLMLPNTDDTRAQPLAGTYVARLGLLAGNGTIGRGTISQKRQRGGVLDVRIAFSPGTVLGPDDDFVTTAVGIVRHYYEDLAGIPLGTVSFAALPDTVDTLDDEAGVFAACAAYSEGTAINLFVIADLSFAGGVAGGVPGPPGLIGTAASCIVIGKQSTATTTGALMAHELGHFLGLFHSSQIIFNGATYALVGHDPLSDTPECEHNTALSDCPDFHNLMFPFFPTTDLTLTPGQIDVLQRSPLLRQ